MSRGPDAGTLLKRALERSADASRCAVVVGDMRAMRWASATFNGARHAVSLSGSDDPALRAWLAGLSEAELPMRGHIVADLVVVSVARSGRQAVVEIEVLTVEG